jgi:oxygen-independent coproporphyrinogen-3 oxidase
VQYFDEYYKAIEEGRIPMNRGLVRSQEEQIRWATILPLKNFFLQKRIFEERTGIPLNQIFPEKIEILSKLGLIIATDNTIKLTNLGAFFADEVVMQFHSNEYLPLTADEYVDGCLNPWNHPCLLTSSTVPSGTPENLAMPSAT